MSQLVDYAGTGEGCVLCGTLTPFDSDPAAVNHYATHSPADLAFAFLREKAIVQRVLEAVDEPGGIQDERQMDDLIREVDDTAHRSPGRP